MFHRFVFFQAFELTEFFILPHVLTSLLGLTEQAPAKAVFLTDGPSRTVRIGFNIPTHLSG